MPVYIMLKEPTYDKSPCINHFSTEQKEKKKLSTSCMEKYSEIYDFKGDVIQEK